MLSLIRANIVDIYDLSDGRVNVDEVKIRFKARKEVFNSLKRSISDMGGISVLSTIQ